MGRIGESWVSDELQSWLKKLTGQQAMGVLRIVQAELEGRSLSSLLDCPDQICTSTTFYGSGRRQGWRQKAAFNQALELARRDYRGWLLERGVGDTLAILARAAPEAARALHQEVAGDDGAVQALIKMLGLGIPGVRKAAAKQLGETGLPGVVPALELAIAREDDPDVMEVMAGALGRIAGWRDGDRRQAAVAVLDRADVKTAAKQAMLLDIGDADIDRAIENELARLASGGEGANVAAVAEYAGAGGSSGGAAEENSGGEDSG